MGSMRRVWAICLALAALSGCGEGSRGGPAPASAPDLLPDLDQAAPAVVTIRREAGRELLVFASAVDNIGSGPLLVELSRPDRSALAMDATQRILLEDGSRRAVATGSVARYVRAETHAHWHLLGFERYELRTPDGARVVASRKQGFCLGDRYDSRGSVRLLGEPDDAVWTGECGKHEPERLSVREGISVGYGDDYVPFLEGQSVDVTDAPPGDYVLVHLANPERSLLEETYANNAASVAVELRRDGRGRARVGVVATCPDEPSCG